MSLGKKCVTLAKDKCPSLMNLKSNNNFELNSKINLSKMISISSVTLHYLNISPRLISLLIRINAKEITANSLVLLTTPLLKLEGTKRIF